MAVTNPSLQPLPTRPWIDESTGLPTQVFLQYLQSLDAAVRAALPFLNATAASALTTSARQNIGGGFTETEFDLGSPANAATVTLDPLNSLKQKITNNVAGFNIAAQTTVGDIELRIINGATAGAITFTGFDKKWTGDALDTVNGHQFVVFIYGYASKKAYIIKALQ